MHKAHLTAEPLILLIWVINLPWAPTTLTIPGKPKKLETSELKRRVKRMRENNLLSENELLLLVRLLFMEIALISLIFMTLYSFHHCHKMCFRLVHEIYKKIKFAEKKRFREIICGFSFLILIEINEKICQNNEISFLWWTSKFYFYEIHAF